jgi:hypothetical protein
MKFKKNEGPFVLIDSRLKELYNNFQREKVFCFQKGETIIYERTNLYDSGK